METTATCAGNPPTPNPHVASVSHHSYWDDLFADVAPRESPMCVTSHPYSCKCPR